MTQDLIPTFKVGERVMLHYRPYEMFCPKCGRQRGIENDIPVQTVTIKRRSGAKLGCYKCHTGVPMPEGFYEIVTDNIPFSFSVPWTLLERIETEREARE